MKVMFIHNRYTQAGGEDVAVELEMQSLASRNHEVYPVIFENEASPRGLINKFTSVKEAVYSKESAARVEKAIGLFQPDIVHVHNWFYEASPSVLDAAHNQGVPVVMTLHNYRLVCANALLLRNNQPCELCVNKTFGYPGVWHKCYHDSAVQSAWVTGITGTHKKRGTWQQKVNTYIVLTEFAKSRLAGSSLNVAPEKMLIKPNFIPDPGESTAPRENFFLYAGRLSDSKGVHVLPDAFRELNSELLIVGEGPEKEALQQKAASAANITFAGGKDRNELLNLMKRCKAVVFPSIWYEGLPFIIIEAFATGTPVIASNLGSMSELIRHQHNGLHFRPGDASDLCQAIRAFENNNTEMYRNARQSYLDHYSEEQHYRSIIRIYEKTIATAGKHV